MERLELLAQEDTPIVQATGASPVDMGLTASLARPGGMPTGVANIIADVSEKHLYRLLPRRAPANSCLSSSRPPHSRGWNSLLGVTLPGGRRTGYIT